MKKIDKRTWITAAVAMVAVLAITALLRIPIVINDVSAGYIHLGDIVVYAAAALLGGPLGALAAAVGAAFADLIVGAYAYIPAAIIFKAILAFIVARGLNKAQTWKDYLRLLCICGGVTVVGYFLYELLFLGFTVAAYGLPFNILQAAVSAAIGALVLKLLNGKSYHQGKNDNPFETGGDPFPKKESAVIEVFPSEFQSGRRNLK